MKKMILLAIILPLLSACATLTPSANVTGEWKLVSYGNPANPTPALPNVEAFIKLDGNGQVGGNWGCNGFGGEYKLNGDKISFGALMMTEMYCDATSPQEQALTSILTDHAALQIQASGANLTLTALDGTTVIQLTRR